MPMHRKYTYTSIYQEVKISADEAMEENNTIIEASKCNGRFYYRYLQRLNGQATRRARTYCASCTGGSTLPPPGRESSPRSSPTTRCGALERSDSDVRDDSQARLIAAHCMRHIASPKLSPSAVRSAIKPAVRPPGRRCGLPRGEESQWSGPTAARRPG